MSTITAKKEIGDELKECTIEYDFGATVEEAVEKFGAEVVFSGFVAKATITAQAAIRRYLETGKSPEEIQELMNSWQPGVALKGESDPVGAVVRKVAAMSDDDKAAFIADLQKKLATA